MSFSAVMRPKIRNHDMWRIRRATWPLWLLSVFVIVVIAYRAATQSITIDEADTYVYWVGAIYHPWTPHANNHLLNTYLIWLFTHLIGLNNVSMRLPTFLGAILYLSATYRFCILFIDGLSLRLPLYACFVLNPFVLDFLVAARGYGLAMGLLITALVILCAVLADREQPTRRIFIQMAIASLCMGLSFAANFSFAVVVAVSTGVFLLAWMWLRRRTHKEMFLARTIAVLLLPATLIVAALCGWTLLHWPKGQLVAGASSIQEMWSTFLLFTFSDLSPRFVGAYIARTLRHWRKALPWLLIAFCLVQLLTAVAERKPWKESLQASRAALVGIYLGAVLCATLVVHWLAFHFAGLLLPKDRTSIFFAPLCLMVAGLAASFPFITIFGRAMRWATVGLLIVGSVYFIGCLRFRYFLQWRFDADMEPTYRKLVEVVGPGRRVEVPTWYLFTSSLNFYRQYFHDDSFGPFWLYDDPQHALETHTRPYPMNATVYVLKLPENKDFIAAQHLKIVYQGPISNDVIAVRQ